MKTLLKLSLAAMAAASLAACSPFVGSGGGIDYKSAQRANALEVPPDLTRISSESRYNMPASTSASAYQAQRQASKGEPAATAIDQAGDVRIHTEGNQHWLVVSRAPQQVWEPVRAFWEDNGFVLSTNDRRVGVMETDWAENRANIPMDGLRRVLGKALDSLYSTGELDRFRTRIERNSSGGTNIYITHRGMKEVLTGRDKESSTWVDRPNDPGLESEMMRRMMVALGVPQERADALAKSAGSAAPVAAAAGQQQAPALQATNGTLTLPGSFDSTWQRVGLSLDRSGFTVEDRDRTAGIYQLRYVTPTAGDAKQPGFFGRLFGSKTPEAKPVQYRVLLQQQGTDTVVRVVDAQGQAAPASDANRILNLLAEDLKRH